MLVTRPISADLDFLDLHRLAPSRYPMLLESAAHGTAQGRWDLLLATSGEALSLHADGSLHGSDGSAGQPVVLVALDGWWHALRVPRGGRRGSPPAVTNGPC